MADSASNFQQPNIGLGKSFDQKQDEARQILNELYSLYAPHKLKDVDVLLEAYAGQEEDLVASVRQKYVKAAKPSNTAAPPKSRGRSSKTAKTVRGRSQSSVPNDRMQGFGNTAQPRRKSMLGRFSIFKRKEKKSHTAAHIGEIGGSSSSSSNVDENQQVSRPSIGNAAQPNEFVAPPQRRSSSMPPPANRNPMPMSRVEKEKQMKEETTLEIRCLDSGQVTTAGQINEEVKNKNVGLALRNLRGRDRFISFFQKYDPEQVENVDRMLSHGGKTEDQLWNHLQVQYKVNQRGRLLAILKLFEPHNARKVDKILQQRDPDEIEELITRLLRKYKPAIEKLEPDPKTWKTGSDNTYQMLPSRDLGD